MSEVTKIKNVVGRNCGSVLCRKRCHFERRGWCGFIENFQDMVRVRKLENHIWPNCGAPSLVLLALFTGVLGTCLHLLDLLPEFNRVLNDANAKLASEAATQLRTMWASAIAGLFIGGLWGETLRFFIKPRLREQPCFLVKRLTKRRPSEPKPAASSPEPNLDQAWQAKDAQGIY